MVRIDKGFWHQAVAVYLVCSIALLGSVSLPKKGKIHFSEALLSCQALAPEPASSIHGHTLVEMAKLVPFLKDNGQPLENPFEYFLEIHERLQIPLMFFPRIPGVHLPVHMPFVPEVLLPALSDPWTFIVRVSGPTSTGEEEYQGETADLWERELVEVIYRNPRARILDLAAGRLPLAILAAKISNAAGAALEIHAIDQGRLLPIDIPAGIRFYQAKMESLPFLENTFDFVMSMHGFGYGEVDSSLRELARVVKPDGRAVVVTHRPDSEIYRTILDNLEIMNVLDSTGLIQAAASYFRTRSRIPFEEALKAPFDVLMKEIDIRQKVGFPTGLLEVTEIVLKMLHQISQEGGRDAAWYCANCMNLSQIALGTHAWPALLRTAPQFSQANIKRFQARAEAYGLSMKPPAAPLYSEGALIGWEMHFLKSA